MIRGRTHVEVRENHLPTIARRMAGIANAAVAKAANDIEAHAKANIRSHDLIDTGNMLNSTRAEQLGPAKWRVTVGAHYGIYHEYGTRHLPARPFFLPAVDLVRPSFMSAMRRLAEVSAA